MTEHPKKLDRDAPEGDTTRNWRAADDRLGRIDMPAAAIEQAQAELRSARSELSRARKAVKALLQSRTSTSAAEVIDTVAEGESLDTTTVQRAIWTLVHDGQVELTENYQLILR